MSTDKITGKGKDSQQQLALTLTRSTPVGKSGKGSGNEGKGVGNSPLGIPTDIPIRRAIPTAYDLVSDDPSTQPMVEPLLSERLAVASCRPNEEAGVGRRWDCVRGGMESVKDMTEEFERLIAREFANPQMATIYVQKNLWRLSNVLSMYRTLFLVDNLATWSWSHQMHGM